MWELLTPGAQSPHNIVRFTPQEHHQDPTEYGEKSRRALGKIGKGKLLNLGENSRIPWYVSQSLLPLPPEHMALVMPGLCRPWVPAVLLFKGLDWLREQQSHHAHRNCQKQWQSQHKQPGQANILLSKIGMLFRSSIHLGKSKM